MEVLLGVSNPELVGFRPMTRLAEEKTRVAARLRVRREALAASRRRERALAAAALVTFFGGGVLVLGSIDGAFGLHWIWTAPAVLALLVGMVAWRERASRQRRNLACSVVWWERALARLDDSWTFGQGAGQEYADQDHPYAGDLDLFGPGSLFERLNGTHTVLGRDVLASLLKGVFERQTVQARQTALQELAADELFRERLEVALGSLAASGGRGERERLEQDTRRLLAWGAEGPAFVESLWWRGLQLVLAAGATGTVAGYAFLGWGFGPLLLAYLVNFILLGKARGLEELTERFERVYGTLRGWSRVMQLLEEWSPDSSLLREIKGPLCQDRHKASKSVARLGVLGERLSRRKNLFWALTFDVLWLYDYRARRALWLWKERFGHELGGWLEAVARLEALASLAAYHAAVPDSVLPELAQGGPLFDGQQVAHPLLARDRRVGNDLLLDAPGRILLVTGSNMSGKSTFLRTVGLCVLLARLGLPVPARKLKLLPLTLVTCMRVHDSLRQGSSQFHAEVSRLAACVGWARIQPPALVLLDEILAGTNSRERHLGTEAVLESLIRLGASVLNATHDLALQELGVGHPEALRVVHFRDQIRDGAMHFDYVMRPGPLPSTNALAVMRAAGLEVPPLEPGAEAPSPGEGQPS